MLVLPQVIFSISDTLYIAFIIMQKQINFVPKLSLTELALRRVVICLWTENDILNVIGKDIFCDLTYWQKTVEVQVKDKVSELVVPKYLKEQMMCIVKPIGIDIVRWMRYPENYIRHFDMRIFKQLQWSCIGLIDYQKTAEKLVCLEIFDVVTRYRLACFHCLVDYIPVLWEEMNVDSRMQFYHHSSFNPVKIREIKLENVWPFILNGEESVLDAITWRNLSKSFNKCVVESVACSGNKAAIEYFFPVMNTEEKDTFLVRTICNVLKYYPPWVYPPDFLHGRLCDGLLHLVFMMRPEEQIKLLTHLPYHVLGCLLDWPWVDHFVDVTNLICTFLPEEFSFSLIFKIVRNYSCFGPNLLKKLFQSGPSYLRRDFVIYEYEQFALFSHLIANEDPESIMVVLRSLDSSDRVNLVTRLNFFEMFTYFMGRDEWHMVELCFQEAVQSQEDTERLKNRFIEVFDSVDASDRLLLRKQEWKQFVELLVADTTSANKRSLEDAEVIKAKTTFH